MVQAELLDELVPLKLLEETGACEKALPGNHWQVDERLHFKRWHKCLAALQQVQASGPLGLLGPHRYGDGCAALREEALHDVMPYIWAWVRLLERV